MCGVSPSRSAQLAKGSDGDGDVCGFAIACSSFAVAAACMERYGFLGVGKVSSLEAVFWQNGGMRGWIRTCVAHADCHMVGATA